MGHCRISGPSETGIEGEDSPGRIMHTRICSKVICCCRAGNSLQMHVLHDRCWSRIGQGLVSVKADAHNIVALMSEGVQVRLSASNA